MYSKIVYMTYLVPHDGVIVTPRNGLAQTTFESHTHGDDLRRLKSLPCGQHMINRWPA